jgi:hypothetical protein
MDIIFCGGTSILPLSFNRDEISRCSILPVVIAAFLSCAGVRVTLLVLITWSVFSAAGLFSPQADSKKIIADKHMMDLMR